MFRYKLAELISEKRYKERRRITFGEIHEKTGVHRTTLSKMHNQHNYNATLDILERICRYFEVDIGDLVTFDYSSEIEPDDKPKVKPKKKGE